MLLAVATSWLDSLNVYFLPALGVLALVSLSILGCVLTVMGMPGNWLILLTAFAYDFLIADGSRIELGIRVLILLLGLAIVGEALELLTGVAGAASKGGSRRGAAGALLGSLAGGILGMGIGIPIPIVGPVVGMIVCAALGALAGTVLAEHASGRELPHAIEIGVAAMWGRVAGSLAKTLVGMLMVAVVILGLVM